MGEEDSKIGDLLEHYSSRAVAHASFFIASVFGIVTFSAIIQQMNVNGFLFWISLFLFLGFSHAGFFTLLRFGYYAELADKLAVRGLRRTKVFKEVKLNLERYNIRNLLDEFEKKSILQIVF